MSRIRIQCMRLDGHKCHSGLIKALEWMLSADGRVFKMLCRAKVGNSNLEKYVQIIQVYSVTSGGIGTRIQ